MEMNHCILKVNMFTSYVSIPLVVKWQIMLTNTSQQQSFDIEQVNLTSDRFLLHGDEKNIKKTKEKGKRGNIFIKLLTDHITKWYNCLWGEGRFFIIFLKKWLCGIFETSTLTVTLCNSSQIVKGHRCVAISYYSLCLGENLISPKWPLLQHWNV